MAAPRSVAQGPAAPGGSKAPVKDHSERSKNRLRQLRMWEEEQRLTDQEDAKMTREQYMTLVASLQSVKCEFLDLDGLSWSTPEARRFLEKWQRRAQQAESYPESSESSDASDDLPSPPGLEASSTSSGATVDSPPTPEDLPDCPMLMLPSLSAKLLDSPSEPIIVVPESETDADNSLHPLSIPKRKRPAPLQTNITIRKPSPLSSAALAAAGLPTPVLSCSCSPSTAVPPSTPATAVPPSTPCRPTPDSSPNPPVAVAVAVEGTPAPEEPHDGSTLDETPRPTRRHVSAPRVPSNPARHTRTGLTRVPSSPRLGALRAPSSPRTGRRAVSGGRTGSKFAIIVVHDRLAGHYCGSTCPSCH
ncbi:hypothetical protein CERSUDRAFT_124601 [Gelatoporia subvermispora B]|uniref:Uncharacterized protein n=1 Tax=Ceriporiopsis subvermispora (strain B) TaxID=914234 RepID=M2QGC9_CERS8|nr:hypothetical protein CERSUDRAFT_124601 [Gelatoporia subvermispora B]